MLHKNLGYFFDNDDFRNLFENEEEVDTYE